MSVIPFELVVEIDLGICEESPGENVYPPADVGENLKFRHLITVKNSRLVSNKFYV